MRKIILSLSAALLASTPVWAINCQVETNCTTLGYTSSKDEGNCLKCPFGNQWACLKNDSSGQEDTTPTPDYSNCKIGDILYSDMSCNANMVASKTPIGVVFDTTNHLAIGLNQSSSDIRWSSDTFDVPGLSNITSSWTVTADWQGKNNTRVVLEFCKANGKSCPAFEYVNSYKTEGTIAGDWYLPAFGELNAIYDNKDVLNIALGKIGGTKVGADLYWSSSEVSEHRAWVLDFNNGNVNPGDKYFDGNCVRPVLAF